MTDRRAFIGAIASGLIVASHAAHAQQPLGRRFRVGGFTSSPPEAQAVFIREFERGMRELGYADGGNAVFEYRWLRGAPNRLPSLAAELVQWPADVIVVGVNAAIAVAQRATSTIPIVMVLASDPIQNGFVKSLAKPGANMTGLSGASEEMPGKLLQTLKEMVPGLLAVGLLAEPGYATGRAAALLAARKLGLRLEEVEIRGDDGIADAFAAMTRRKIGGFIVIGGALTYGRRQQIADLALENRLPGIHFTSDYARAGLLATYGPSLIDRYRRSAVYVDKIYKGAKPADLPVEQPTRFELVINLKTAKALGIAIPQSLLLRADEVIQ